jgi:hypothetical protein
VRLESKCPNTCVLKRKMFRSFFLHENGAYFVSNVLALTRAVFKTIMQKKRMQQDFYTLRTFPEIFSLSLQLKLATALKSLISPDPFEVRIDRPRHCWSMECFRSDLTQTHKYILCTDENAHLLCGNFHSNDAVCCLHGHAVLGTL